MTDTRAIRRQILDSIARLADAAGKLDGDSDFFGVAGALRDVRESAHTLNNLAMKLVHHADELGKQCEPRQTVEGWFAEPPPPLTAGKTPTRATDGPPSGLERLGAAIAKVFSSPHQDDAGLGPDPFDGVLPADVPDKCGCGICRPNVQSDRERS